MKMNIGQRQFGTDVNQWFLDWPLIIERHMGQDQRKLFQIKMFWFRGMLVKLPFLLSSPFWLMDKWVYLSADQYTQWNHTRIFYFIHDPTINVSLPLFIDMSYPQTPYIKRTFSGNKIVDHSDVVGASPVGAAPTISPFASRDMFQLWDLVHFILEVWRYMKCNWMHSMNTRRWLGIWYVMIKFVIVSISENGTETCDLELTQMEVVFIFTSRI